MHYSPPHPPLPGTAPQIEIYNSDRQAEGGGASLGYRSAARVQKPAHTLTSELLFNHQGILMACQNNEIWLEATWCKHYDKSLSHKPTRGLMVINHHFGERKMTAIKIMNGMINFSH